MVTSGHPDQSDQIELMKNGQKWQWLKMPISGHPVRLEFCLSTVQLYTSMYNLWEFKSALISIIRVINIMHSVRKDRNMTPRVVTIQLPLQLHFYALRLAQRRAAPRV